MDIPEEISDLINLEIPTYWRVWKPFMKKYDCRVIAEIGVFEGTNFDLMIQHEPHLAVAVDAWVDDGIIAHHDSGFPQDVLDKMYQDFSCRMAQKPFVKIKRGYSDDVAKKFPDNYFDFIYIDADHTYEGCKKDIEAWYPKVKKGKFLTGDDYWHHKSRSSRVRFGVVEAVNGFAKANNLIVYELPRHGWATIKP